MEFSAFFSPGCSEISINAASVGEIKSFKGNPQSWPLEFVYDNPIVAGTWTWSDTQALTFSRLFLDEGGRLLCVCYKAFTKGIKHWGISLATFSFPGHLGSTSLKRPLQRGTEQKEAGAS